MANLRIEHLHKRYGATTVLNDVNLKIEDGEFVVLVGPSGCGKSTLLRMIAGLDGASGGDIHIADKLVNTLAPADRGIAMVFQSYALYPHMNVRKNMTFGLKFTGVPPAERERRVTEAARMLRLDELLGRYPRDLSGGQRQRVAIGRAIVREPAVFLFDEPLSNLDAALRVSTRVEIANLHRMLKSTIVYVTHDQVEAMTLADRIVVMNKGCIEQVGRPLDLYYAPANLFVAGFIGSPAMNFFDAKVASVEGACARVDGGGFRSFDLPATSLKMGDTLTVGVRPEHLGRREDGSFTVEGVVELVERLGESSFAYVRRADDRLFVAEVRGRQTPTPGERIVLAAANRDVHVFDASGLRVSSPTNA
ncbi:MULTISPECIES: ABC transporter ATP-binding protein [unclassified Bradyrhizobium]